VAVDYGGIGSLLLCCVIAGVLAIPEWLMDVESVWKKHWFGYCLIVVGAGVCWWFNSHLRPWGYAFTAMAVVAGVMALRQDMGGHEKSFWFVLLLAFMVVEIRAINRDRATQEGNFTTTANGLKSAIQGLQETIRTLTGGDSFPEVLAEQPNQQGCIKLSISAVGN
jgi:hypothetical protein